MDKNHYFYYLDKAKGELSKGRIEPSIVYLQDCLGILNRSHEFKLSCKEIRNDLIAQLSRYARCKNNKMNGASNPATIEHQMSAITNSIISIIGEIEDIMDTKESSIFSGDNGGGRDVKTLVATEVESLDIEIHINKEFEKFSESDRKKLLDAIGNLLEMDEADIKIKRIRRGSIKITLNLPKDKARKLLRVIENGDLLDISVTNARVDSGDADFIAEPDLSNYLPMNIKSLRRKLRFSQGELAHKLGLNRGNIASYENGSAEPKILNLLKLSNFFGVSMIDLTRKNLSEENNLQSALEKFQDISESVHELQAYARKAKEIEEYFEDLTKAIDHKKSTKEGLSKDVRHLLDYYEQLHQASIQLILDYQSLIEFVNKRVK